MPLYEHVFIARQDLTNAQAEALIESFSAIVQENGGRVTASEYWGLRSMAYKINKNRKGHYALMKLDAPAGAVAELERLSRIHEDVLRCMSVRVDGHENGPSAVVQAKSDRGSRRDRRE